MSTSKSTVLNFLSKYKMVLIHVAALASGLLLLIQYLTGSLNAYPIQEITFRTGKTALILLMISLSMTPLKTITGWSWTATVRKWAGLYAFFYAFSHMLVFVWWDYGFAWQYILPQIFSKRYLLVGASAIVILFLMAFTSYQWWVKRLGRGWTYLHRFVYVAGVLVVLHYAWVQKGDLFTLQGNVLQPFLFALYFILLMVLRIPFIRRKIVQSRRARARTNQPQNGPVVVRRTRPSSGAQGE
ncbi:MAG: sulfoxide reductase heme-binding subunit YedZ [Anaerolineaceae bacterium]|nr:sulfoxide reductase heme-binding subunit YedZ [Anaerolineaceae bacterium]